MMKQGTIQWWVKHPQYWSYLKVASHQSREFCPGTSFSDQLRPSLSTGHDSSYTSWAVGEDPPFCESTVSKHNLDKLQQIELLERNTSGIIQVNVCVILKYPLSMENE